jgi:regulator of sirC expression with transglutaminase-like and TPR domain
MAMILKTISRPSAPDARELEALVSLLDDETPEVRDRVADRLGDVATGDLSEWLSSRNPPIPEEDASLLSDLLAPARRTMLRREWLVPSGGGGALAEDWERFEALLRVLSDFLHDGVTLRQPLSDAIDLLAEEAAGEDCEFEEDLIEFLFGNGRFQGNREAYHDPRNADLAWVAAEGKSNPIGLSLVLLLVAGRMEMDVEGVNFPGHFLCRIYRNGEPWIVDCFDSGKLHRQADLLAGNSELTRQQKRLLEATADPGIILHRMLNNLIVALHREGRHEDCALVRELRETLL